jgi:hypothetical protein
MSELTNYQLQLLSELNFIRVALTKEFKSKPNPAPEVFFKNLLKL